MSQETMTYAEVIKRLTGNVAEEAAHALRLGNPVKELKRGIKLQQLCEKLDKLVSLAKDVQVIEPVVEEQ